MECVDVSDVAGKLIVIDALPRKLLAQLAYPLGFSFDLGLLVGLGFSHHITAQKAFLPAVIDVIAS